MNEGFIPTQLAHHNTDRLKRYKELLDFYYGRHWEGYAKRGEKRLTFNYAKVVIDKATSYLMSGITFTVEAVEDSDEARARAQRAERALYQVYEDNNLEQLDLETEIDCAILGNACFKVIWDTETKGVRINAPDIQGIYTWWLGDDTSRVWRIASRYNLTSDEAEILYKVKPKGKTANVVELWTAHDFELWLDNAQVEKKPNPYGFIPFVIYPNLREPKKFWGISDLPQIMEPQQELNRAMSQLEDRNIDSVSKAEQRGDAYLRQAEIESASGAIQIPPNCGQQLYDVIDVTDSRAGLSEAKKRVLGLTLVYNPRHGEYGERLLLGAV